MTSDDRKFRRSTCRIVVPAVFPMCRKITVGSATEASGTPGPAALVMGP